MATLIIFIATPELLTKTTTEKYWAEVDYVGDQPLFCWTIDWLAQKLLDLWWGDCWLNIWTRKQLSLGAMASERCHDLVMTLGKLSSVNQGVIPGWFFSTVSGSIPRHAHGPLTRYVKLRVAHAPGMLGTFSGHRLRRKPLVSDPGMHHGTCVTYVPWCLSGSLTRGGRENVSSNPDACATRSFTYLVRGPCVSMSVCMPNRMRLISSHMYVQAVVRLSQYQFKSKFKLFHCPVYRCRAGTPNADKVHVIRQSCL